MTWMKFEAKSFLVSGRPKKPFKLWGVVVSLLFASYVIRTIGFPAAFARSSAVDISRHTGPVMYSDGRGSIARQTAERAKKRARRVFIGERGTKTEEPS